MDTTTNILNYLTGSIKQSNNTINATHPYPCGICKKNVNKKQKAIECIQCNQWIHIKCNGTSLEDYNIMLETNNILSEEEIADLTWISNKCKIIENAHIFPFGLENTHDLQNIIQSDSIASFDCLPSYKIYSKASTFNSLKNSDIDENIVANLNSRYYTAHEFKTLKRDQSFNIFHSNLDGLENKFELLHNFITSSNMDIDIINISETSQKLNESFNSNLSSESYTRPFTTGSKFSKGGVAIYAMENLNVIERDDLKEISDSFEIIWIEINMDKTKNIICGCAYRHPNTDISIFTNYISKCLRKINKENKLLLIR